MATVSIPLLFKDLTGGARQAEVKGSTVGEIITALDEIHPGIERKIRHRDKINPTVALTVDGKIAVHGLSTPVKPDSEVCLLPSFGGG